MTDEILFQIFEKVSYFTVQNLGQSNQLADFDIHTIGFNLGITALGDRDAHQIHFGNDLILFEFTLVAPFLNVAANTHIHSDLLYHIFSIS